jgi:energy-converting hydrogenase Eha subunit C
MRTSLLLIFTSIFMGAIGQILLKTGMSKIGYISIKYSDIIQNVLKAFVSPYILVGILSYLLSMILWLIILLLRLIGVITICVVLLFIAKS